MTSDARLRDALVGSLAGGCSSPGSDESRTDVFADVAEACRSLDRAASLGAVLNEAASAAARLVGAAVLFVVRNGRLQMRRSIGFDQGAAGSGSGRAFPIVVGGRVVAVLYVEPIGRVAAAGAAGAHWGRVIDVVTSYAGRVLESMTLQRALGLTSPRLDRGAGASRPRPAEGLR